MSDYANKVTSSSTKNINSPEYMGHFKAETNDASIEYTFIKRKTERLIVFTSVPCAIFKKEIQEKLNTDFFEDSTLYIRNSASNSVSGLGENYCDIAEEEYWNNIANLVKTITKRNKIDPSNIILVGGGCMSLITVQKFFPEAGYIVVDLHLVEKRQINYLEHIIEQTTSSLSTMDETNNKILLLFNKNSIKNYANVKMIVEKFNGNLSNDVMNFGNICICSFSSDDSDANILDDDVFGAIIHFYQNGWGDSLLWKIISVLWATKSKLLQVVQKTHLECAIGGPDFETAVKYYINTGFVHNNSYERSIMEYASAEDKLRLAYAYYKGVDGKVKKNILKTIEWMRAAVDADINYSNEFCDILWKIGTRDAFDEMYTIATARAKAGDGGAMLRLGRAYREGKGVKKDLGKAAEWMRAAVNKGIGSASNELFDVLWNIKTQDSYREMIDVATARAKAGDGGAMLRLGSAYREGKGVKKDIGEAIKLMKKSVSSGGPASAQNELAAMLWERRLPEDDKDLKSLSEEMASKGDPLGYLRLARIYRDGRGVEKNLDEAIKLMKKSVELGIPSWGEREYLSLLAERHDSEDCVEIIKFNNSDIQDFTDYQISRLYFNGLAGNVDLKTIYKKSQKYCNNNHLVKPSCILNERLLRYDNYCIYANESDIDTILAFCLQNNLRPDFLICDGLEFFLPIVKSINIEDVTDFNSVAIITMENDIPKEFNKEDVFFVDRFNEPSSLLVYNFNLDKDINKIDVTDRWKVEPDKAVDYSKANLSGYLVIFRNDIAAFVRVKEVLRKYQVGKEIYDSLDTNSKWVTSRWDNIGDIFKIVSLVRDFKKFNNYKKVGVIVRDRLEGISSLFDSVDDELSLSRDQYDALNLYIEYNLAYDSKIWYSFPAWSPFMGYTRTVLGTYMLPDANEPYDSRKEVDRFKSLMRIPLSGKFERIRTAERKRKGKVLLNPFGGWIYNQFDQLEAIMWNLFDIISQKCVEAGMRVYTNYNKGGRVLSGSEMYGGSVCELAKEIGEFSSIISVCTGLTDMIVLTDCNLHIIYPNENWSKEFSKRELCDRDGIFEYVYSPSNDSEQIVDKIITGIRETHQG